MTPAPDSARFAPNTPQSPQSRGVVTPDALDQALWHVDPPRVIQTGEWVHHSDANSQHLLMEQKALNIHSETVTSNGEGSETIVSTLSHISHIAIGVAELLEPVSVRSPKGVPHIQPQVPTRSLGRRGSAYLLSVPSRYLAGATQQDLVRQRTQMWSPPGLNVESYVEPLRSPRSGVMAHRPPRPLVHLSQISGPVRSFFFLSCLFSGISCACRRAVVGFGCVERFGGAGIGFSGALKPTVGVTVGAGSGCVPSRAVPVG